MLTDKDKAQQLKYQRECRTKIPFELTLDRWDKLKGFCGEQRVPVSTFVKEAVKEKMDEE